MAMASIEAQADGRAVLAGELQLGTVAALLDQGARLIAADRATVIDLAAVTAGDSAGLALLIEWLSIARGQGRPLRYEHVPAQLLQLARLSEVEELLTAAA